MNSAEITRTSFADLSDAALAILVRDELTRRGIPHTIWTGDALRDAAQCHLFSSDMTPQEIQKAIWLAQTTDEWRELSEPTVHHHILVSQAFEQGAFLAIQQKAGTP